MEYKIYQSNLIVKNHRAFVENCSILYNYIIKTYNVPDTTWAYDKYNTFSLTSGSVLFYKLYKELNYHIRSFIADDRPMWINSWLNYHPNTDILDQTLGKEKHFHGHTSMNHGYISIDPQDTTTKFRNGLEVKNKIGQIYMGPGNQNKIGENGEWDHFVESLSFSSIPRITIGFDLMENKYDFNPERQLPLIPLL